jgi:hypothetical protein
VATLKLILWIVAALGLGFLALLAISVAIGILCCGPTGPGGWHDPEELRDRHKLGGKDG